MPSGTRTGPQIGSLTRKKRRQRFFSFAGKNDNTSQSDAGEPPQTTKTGEDRPHDHTLPTDPLTHTQTTERDFTSPIGGLAACFWPAAQLKSGPAPAATASETAAGRLGHRTGMPAAPDAAELTPRTATAAANLRKVNCLILGTGVSMRTSAREHSIAIGSLRNEKAGPFGAAAL